ncbi:metal ABC transporter substrate-binding protein [Paenibacillus farraposensis]|uniref:Metal ABC transporter substrate-binding protein n=1 Tax=Paenibacillus farraposensis TaxID=2807095 RepID=A0ABW4D867_9BACL|nr:metal ABC transporter substrate-binding protein [Paenibacillus farraposensis]MCC3378250.1 zinc ABC transporter substrate-binding protein [Paenibacillus farraposensis]
MNTWFKKSFVLSAGLALILSGCGTPSDNAPTNDSQTGPGTTQSGNKLNVVTTFYPMYEFTRQVAGDHANVTALIPAGAEPHDWEPSAKDMAQVKDADVFVYNGIVEGWAEQALSSAPSDKRVVVEASKGLQLMEGTAEEGEEAHAEEGHDHDHVMDPHVWLDPVLAQKEVESIEAGLVEADPANKADYEKNAAAYIAKLKELDTAFKTGLKDAKRKDFITQHAAFGYLAKQYGLTQVPIAGLSPEQEPTPDKLAGIIKFSKENNVKTIFFETLVDPKVAQTVSTEIGAKTDVLNPLEGLTDEDMKNNLDYLGVMKNNLEALKKALNE